MESDEAPADVWAPLVISVYDRDEHFLQTVSSLAENEGADRTTLYISSDGPKSVEAMPRIATIRSAIAELSGFKNVVAWTPVVNTRGKIRDELLEYVKTKHDSYIFSEDDNVFSPFFLKFINDGLRSYSGEARVRAICGYLPPGIQIESPHQVFLKSFVPWGFGTWSKKTHTESPRCLALRVLKDPQLFSEMNRNLPHLARLNRKVMTENLNAEDAYTANDMFVRDQVCVFPPQSLVRNIGHDGSGLNSKKDLRFIAQKISKSPVDFDEMISISVDAQNSAQMGSFLGGRFVTLANYLIHFEFRTSNKLLGSFLAFSNKTGIALGARLRTMFRHFRNRRIRSKQAQTPRNTDDEKMFGVSDGLDRAADDER